MEAMRPVLLAFLSIARLAHAVYVPVEDTEVSYPVLKHALDGTVLRWSLGDTAALRLSSTALRISNRGVRFVAPTMRLSNLHDWAQTRCTFVEDALCQTPAGDLLFPESALQALVPASGSGALGAFTSLLSKSACSRSAARTVVDIDWYAVTLCDITQKGFHFVLDGDLLYTRQKEESFLFYLLVSIGTVVLVTAVAQNIAHLLDTATAVTSVFLELGMSLLLTGVCSFSGLNFATEGDTLYYWFTFGYVLVNLAYWVLRLYSTRDPAGAQGAVPVNVLLGALLLTLTRLYDGAESEYVTPVLFLLLVRCFHKGQKFFYTPLLVDTVTCEDPYFMHADTPLYFFGQVTLLLDFTLAGLTHQYGFRSLFHKAHVGDMFFGVLALAAYSLSVLLWDRSLRRLP